MSARSNCLRLVPYGFGAFVVLFVVWSMVPFGPRSPFATREPKKSASWTDRNLRDISNATLGFEKILVINLPYRTDHRDAISLSTMLSGLQVEYVSGVSEVDEKTLPPLEGEQHYGQGQLGNWRAHMNAVRLVVEQNLTSALILEDDADWDVRLKDQMRDFAEASRLLVQPIEGLSEQFLDPTFPKPKEDSKPTSFEVGKQQTVTPTSSPYGDIERWDLFWLGHCGTRFPRASDKKTPLGRALILNDTTVPEPQHIHMQFGNDELIKEHPSHTRVVSRARANVCTLGYAVSRPGARRLLWEGGVHKFTGTTDMMLRSICDGEWGRQSRICLSVQPQIFQHHRPKGSTLGFSDINPGEGKNEHAFTRNIRWSTRMNLAKLLEGKTDYIDQFRDGSEDKLGDHW